MANYSLLVTPTFKPRTFAEMAVPYQMYGEYYNALESSLSTLESALADMEKLKQFEGHEQLYEQYQNFADQLNTYSDKLASGNLKGLRSNIRTAAKDYVKNIKPIEDAYTRVVNDHKRYAELVAQNPSILNAPSDNIMTYYNDPLYSWTPITGEYLRSTMGALAQAYQNEYSGFTYDGPNIVNHFGLNSTIIPQLAAQVFKDVWGKDLPALGEKALGEKEVSKYQTLIDNMEQLRDQYGFDNMDDAQKLQFVDYVIQGLNAGIGQDRVAQRPTVSNGSGRRENPKILFGGLDTIPLPLSQDSKTKDVENNYSNAIQNQELTNAHYNKYVDFFTYSTTGEEKNVSSIKKEVNNATPWLENLSKEGMNTLINAVDNNWSNFRKNGITVKGRDGKPLNITANMLQVSGLADADKLRLLDEATDWIDAQPTVPVFGTVAVTSPTGQRGVVVIKNNYAAVYKDIMYRTGTFNAPVPTKGEVKRTNEKAQEAIKTVKSDYPAFAAKDMPAVLNAVEDLSTRSSKLVYRPIMDANSAKEIVSTFRQKAGFNSLTKATPHWSDIPSEEIVSYNFKTKQYHPVNAAELEDINDVKITMGPDGKMYYYMAKDGSEGRYYIQKNGAASKGADDYSQILNYFINLKMAPEGDILSTDVMDIQRQVNGDTINVTINGIPYNVPIAEYPEFVGQIMEQVSTKSFLQNPELNRISTNFLNM